MTRRAVQAKGLEVIVVSIDKLWSKESATPGAPRAGMSSVGTNHQSTIGGLSLDLDNFSQENFI